MSYISATTVQQVSSAQQPQLDELRVATGRVVGSLFFGTLLKTMREAGIQGEYGHGGRGEEVFAAQFHGLLAERMGERMHDGLADQLYRHLAKQQSLMSDRAKESEDSAV